jgi:hypothetical protein
MGILHRDAIHVVSSMIALNLAAAWGAEPEWPRFRGPDANPVVAKGKVAGEVVEDGERGMGGGDSRARVVLADCERA